MPSDLWGAFGFRGGIDASVLIGEGGGVPSDGRGGAELGDCEDGSEEGGFPEHSIGTVKLVEFGREATPNYESDGDESECGEGEFGTVGDTEGEDEGGSEEEKRGCEEADGRVHGVRIGGLVGVEAEHGKDGEDAEEEAGEGEDLAEGSCEDEGDGEGALKPDDPGRDDGLRGGCTIGAIPSEHGIEHAGAEERGGSQRREERECDDCREKGGGFGAEEVSDEEFDDGAAFCEFGEGDVFEEDVVDGEVEGEDDGCPDGHGFWDGRGGFFCFTGGVDGGAPAEVGEHGEHDGGSPCRAEGE